MERQRRSIKMKSNEKREREREGESRQKVYWEASRKRNEINDESVRVLPPQLQQDASRILYRSMTGTGGKKSRQTKQVTPHQNRGRYSFAAVESVFFLLETLFHSSFLNL